MHKKAWFFKNKTLLGILGAMLVFGTMAAGCSDDDGDPAPDPNALTGTVSIAGNPSVGQTLTAGTGSLGGTGAIAYQWKADGTDIDGATDDTYTLTSAEVGKTITVTVTRTGYTGSKTSAATAAVTAADLNALTGTVSVTGTAIVGQTLEADTSSLGAGGTISYQWKANGTAISGATDDTYTLTSAEEGKTITVTVERDGKDGSQTSAATAAVVAVNTDPKTLVIQNIPADVYAYGAVAGSAIGVYSLGTTPQQAQANTGYVAGAGLRNDDIVRAGSGPYTLTIPLYVGTTERWMGNGAFTVYVMLLGGGGHYYSTDVTFTSATTTILFNSAAELK